jgi:acyl-CoA thioesterase FadM
MVLAQVVRNAGDGTEVARALVTAVFVGQDRRPMRVPDHVREALGGASS